MLWLALWIAVLALGALGVVASANSLRFGRRVGREVRQLWAEPTDPLRIDRRRIDELPGSVRPYIARAVGERDRAVRTARLRHGGTFRTKLKGTWVPIRGEQHFAADPPGFVWWGRVRVAPGPWFAARDRSVSGVGNMHASLESSVSVVDGSGPEIDQGALLELWGENDPAISVGAGG